MIKKMFLIVICLMILSMTLPLAQARSGQPPILLGAVYPLTGDVAPIGQNIKRGIDLAVDDINAIGGIGGRPLQIVWGDTQGDPKLGMSEIERLITRENVPCVIGAYQSGVTEVLTQVAERYQTPMMTCISTATVITTHGYKYFFRMQGTNAGFLRSMVIFFDDFNKRKLEGKLKTFAVVADNTLLGQETLEWGKYWAEQMGYKSVAEVLFNRGSADLTSEVLELKRANPDILIGDCYIADALLLTRNMVEQNFRPGIFVTKGTGFMDPSFVPGVGNIANGITTTVEWAADMTKGQDVNLRFKQRYNIDMNGHSALAYTGVWLMKTALEKTGEKSSLQETREALRETMANLIIDDKFPNGPEIMLPWNQIRFETSEVNGVLHTNQNPNAIQAIAQIKDGKYVTVWPFELTKGEAIYPAPMK